MSRSSLRSIFIMLFAAVLVSQVAVMSLAGADTASDLDAARETVALAQAEANANAAELSKAVGRAEEIQANIDQTTAAIEDAHTRIGALEELVRSRAASAYVNRGNGGSPFAALFSTKKPLDVRAPRTFSRTRE